LQQDLQEFTARVQLYYVYLTKVKCCILNNKISQDTDILTFGTAKIPKIYNAP